MLQFLRVKIQYFEVKLYFECYSVAVFLSWARQHIKAADQKSNLRLHVNTSPSFLYKELCFSILLRHVKLSFESLVVFLLQL